MSLHMYGRIGAAIAAGLAHIGPGTGMLEDVPPRPVQRVGRREVLRNYVPGTTYTTDFSNKQHGKRECRRRRNQIQSGSLRHDNGLDPAAQEFGMSMRQLRLSQEAGRRNAGWPIPRSNLDPR